MKHCESLCTDPSAPMSAYALKKITFWKGQVTKVRKWHLFLIPSVILKKIKLDVFIANIAITELEANSEL